MTFSRSDLDLIVHALRNDALNKSKLSRRILESVDGWPPREVFERSARIDMEARDERNLADRIIREALP